jgi:hypothetical protein
MLFRAALLLQLAFVCSTGVALAAPVYRAQILERWRIAGESEDLIVGTIVDAVADSSGVTYLLDYRLQHVLVVGSNGESLRRIGGEGDGPGETRHAGRLFLVEDQRIGLLDVLSSKISWLDTMGRPLSSTNVRFRSDGSGVFGTYDARICGDGYVAAFMQQNTTGEEGRFQVTLAYVRNVDTEPLVMLQVPDKASGRRGPVDDESDHYNFVWNCWDVSQQGNVFVAPSRDKDEIAVFSVAEGHLHTFDTGVERRPRTEEEVEIASQRFVELGRQRGAVKIADADPYFEHIWCDEDGRAWVYAPSSKRNGADEVFRRYDVYLPSGELVYSVELVGPWERRFDECYMLSSGSMVIVENARSSRPGSGEDLGDGSSGLSIVRCEFELPER